MLKKGVDFKIYSTWDEACAIIAGNYEAKFMQYLNYVIGNIAIERTDFNLILSVDLTLYCPRKSKYNPIE